MKIIWICNKTPVLVSEQTGGVINSSGGWLEDMGERLLGMNGVSLVILSREKTVREIKTGNLSFYSFKEKNCAERIELILKAEKPDIIHIWGTEFRHTYETLKIADGLGIVNRCVVSIQGLVSLCGKYHYTEGLPHRVIVRYTLWDFFRRQNIRLAQKSFIARGEFEIEAIKHTKHIIGRTDWDKAASELFNPEASYHFCNESLRKSFYQHKWDIHEIQRHSVFVSQCGYPIKGFHYVLEAMPEILKHYPDAHIYTTGIDLLHLSFKQKLMLSSYQRYLLELICRFDLYGHVSFLGQLSEEQMCEQYLRAHTFVSASTIENSPNSLGEAMLLGCPVVASDVGGVKNMLLHTQEGYIYQSSAPYMLAYYVKKIFADDDEALIFSKNAQHHAAQTHDRENNMKALLDIYQTIASEDTI